MRTLHQLRVGVPDEVRIVGIDDVKYAGLLGVPLTTVRQPCREIGEGAISLMLDRIAHPGMPSRDILLDCKLVVRKSCGSHLDNTNTRKRKPAGEDSA
jgi:DNA-binding LacI/PurR family transcriptional regulator